MPTLEQSVSHILTDNAYTPDIGFLEKMYSYVPLFMYGAMQQDMSQAKLLGNFPRIGVGITKHDRFNMNICQNEPVVFDCGTPVVKRAIFGEVYIVPPVVIRDLDCYMCRGIQFRRQYEPIIYKKPEDKKPAELNEAEAFMYIGMVDEWRRYLQSKPENAHIYLDENFPHKSYYRFTFHDDKPNLPEVDDTYGWSNQGLVL